MKDSLQMEMVPQVDYERSIKNHRLLYKRTFGFIFDNILTYIASLFLIGIVALIIPMMINGVKNPYKLFFVIICCILFDAWMIINLILTNTLVKIDGKDLEINKKNILETLDAFYDNINSSRIDGNIIRNVKLSTSFRWGRIITVLLNEDIVYLNIITLGRYDSMSPFHGLSNYLKCRRIAQSFELKQL
jgi:hypothetical protein